MIATFKRFVGGTAAVAAVLLLTGPALADGMRGSIKDAPKPAEKPRCTFSANVALTTEYVFRGVSQTAEGPAVQGGFDATCGIFYAGVWASNLDWGPSNFGDAAGHIEMDWYLGIKPVTGKVTWDLGVIYYTYPNSALPAAVQAGRFDFEANYVELKVGASGEVWKDGTLGATVFYSPNYQFETRNVWTIETSFAQVLPKIGRFTPTFSTLLGYQTGDNTAYALRVGNLDDHYFYWNAGVSFAFMEKWSVDFRYWDTSLKDNAGGSAFCKGTVFQCDERFVATLKFTY